MTTLKSIIESGDYWFNYNRAGQLAVREPVKVTGVQALVADSVVASRLTIEDSGNVTILNSSIALLVVKNANVRISGGSRIGRIVSNTVVTISNCSAVDCENLPLDWE